MIHTQRARLWYPPFEILDGNHCYFLRELTCLPPPPPLPPNPIVFSYFEEGLKTATPFAGP